jgi:hypothetical protein
MDRNSLLSKIVLQHNKKANHSARLYYYNSVSHNLNYGHKLH